jgi:peptidoglycan hydrolase-like protein with peptidoglycan-binding domain
MPRKLSIIALMILTIILVVPPVRKSITNLFNKDKVIEAQGNIMSYRLKPRDKIMQAQIALKKAGFYKGDIDGRSGPQTKEAVKVFQRSKRLSPDGVIGAKTWEEIAKLPRN